VNRRGMNLQEAVVIPLMFGCAIVGWHFGRAAIGGTIGGGVGAVLGFAAIPLIIGIFFLLSALIVEGIPHLPRCRNDRCGAEDYDVKRREGGFLFVCQCGDSYVRRGKHFRLLVDGREVPYLRWRSFRGWRSEQAQEGAGKGVGPEGSEAIDQAERERQGGAMNRRRGR